MPFPLGVNFARIEAFFHGNSKTFSNIWWYTTLSAFPGSWDIATAAAAFETATGAAAITGMDQTINYIGCNFLVHNAGLARSINTYQSIAGSISGTGVPVPDDVALVVTRYTSTPGPSGRGRLYFAGLNSGHVDENRVSTAGHTVWAAICTQFKAAVVDQTMTWSPANWSRHTTAFHAATDFVIAPVLGTRRDRKPRR
jgi:hypothetical protein